jgi:sterol O-acyltransferase
MAKDQSRTPHPVVTDPIDDASHFIGQLQSDGTVSIKPATPSQEADPTVPDISTGEFPTNHRAMLAAAETRSTSSSISTLSEDDYDSLKYEAATIIPGGKGAGILSEDDLINSRRQMSSPGDLHLHNGLYEDLNTTPARRPTARLQRRVSIPVKLEKTDRKGQYRLTAEDYELRDILRQRLEHDSDSKGGKRRSKFSDLVFTRQFTAFDRQNPVSASFSFHGFFTLFWLGTALLIIRVASQNWKDFGSIFGRNEIMGLMFRRDVVVLGLTDGVMCGATAMGLLLQKAILNQWLSWNREGWIIQHVSIYFSVISHSEF